MVERVKYTTSAKAKMGPPNPYFLQWKNIIAAAIKTKTVDKKKTRLANASAEKNDWSSKNSILLLIVF